MSESDRAWRRWAQTVPKLGFDESMPSYGDWHHDELEIRGFLITSNVAADKLFADHWEDIREDASQRFDPDHDDPFDVFDKYTDEVGVSIAGYMWQLSSAVIKDACGLYEVFLEQTAWQVVRKHGGYLKSARSDKSWSWRQCKAFYANYVGINVLPGPVDDIVWMRNKLAHLRDELRTSEARDEFKTKLAAAAVSGPPTPIEQQLCLADEDYWIGRGVEVTPLQTYRLLDTLRRQVHELTGQLFALVYGDATTKSLDAVRSGSPPKVKDFNGPELIGYTKV